MDRNELISWFESWDLKPADILYSHTELGDGIYQRLLREALDLGGDEFVDWIEETIFAHQAEAHFIAGPFKEWDDVWESYQETFLHR